MTVNFMPTSLMTTKYLTANFMIANCMTTTGMTVKIMASQLFIIQTNHPKLVVIASALAAYWGRWGEGADVRFNCFIVLAPVTHQPLLTQEHNKTQMCAHIRACISYMTCGEVYRHIQSRSWGRGYGGAETYPWFALNMPIRVNK